MIQYDSPRWAWPCAYGTKSKNDLGGQPQLPDINQIARGVEWVTRFVGTPT